WIALVAALVAAPFLAADDPTPRRTYVSLLAWLTPIAVVWGTQRPDEPRLLAPAWPAFALLVAVAPPRAPPAPFPPRRAAARPPPPLPSRSSRSPMSSRWTGSGGAAGGPFSISARPGGATAPRWRTSPTGRSRTTSTSHARTCSPETASSRATAGCS